MTPKQILHVIQTKGLKEMRSETRTLMHTHKNLQADNNNNSRLQMHAHTHLRITDEDL